MDRTEYPTRLQRLDEEHRECDTRTPAVRIAMVWTLTLQAWSFKGGGDAESRLRRDVGRVVRKELSTSSSTRTRSPHMGCPAPRGIWTSGAADDGQRASRLACARSVRRPPSRADARESHPADRIDILTSITGVDFEEAANNRVVVEIEGLEVPVL